MEIGDEGLRLDARVLDARDPVRQLAWLALGERGDVISIVVYAFGLGILALAVPLAVQAIVNFATMGGLIQPVVVVSLMLAVTLGLAVSLRLAQARLVEMMQRRMLVRIASELDARMETVDQSALASRGPRELFNRFFDVFTLQKAVITLMVDGVDALVVAAVGIVLLASYHPALLVFSFGLIASLWATLRLSGAGAVRTSIDESKEKYRLAALLQERASMAAGGELSEEHDHHPAQGVLVDYLDARDRHFRVYYRQLAGAWVLQAVTLVALLVLGAWLIGQGQLSIGQLVAAELVVAGITQAIRKLASKAETLYDAVAAMDKVGALFRVPPRRPAGESGRTFV